MADLQNLYFFSTPRNELIQGDHSKLNWLEARSWMTEEGIRLERVQPTDFSTAFFAV
jgi:hypothetical protein